MPTKANTNDRKIQEQRTIQRERRILQFLNGVRSAQQIVNRVANSTVILVY